MIHFVFWYFFWILEKDERTKREKYLRLKIACVYSGLTCMSADARIHTHSAQTKRKTVNQTSTTEMLVYVVVSLSFDTYDLRCISQWFMANFRSCYMLSPLFAVHALSLSLLCFAFFVRRRFHPSGKFSTAFLVCSFKPAIQNDALFT